MGRPQKGEKTPGSGRQKGTPNKSTIDAKSLAEKVGVDPLEILFMASKGDWAGLGYPSKTETRFAQGGEPYEIDRITIDHRINAAKEASKYLYSQRKAIEHSVDPESGPKLEAMLGMIKGIIEEDD